MLSYITPILLVIGFIFINILYLVFRKNENESNSAFNYAISFPLLLVPVIFHLIITEKVYLILFSVSLLVITLLMHYLKKQGNNDTVNTFRQKLLIVNIILVVSSVIIEPSLHKFVAYSLMAPIFANLLERIATSFSPNKTLNVASEKKNYISIILLFLCGSILFYIFNGSQAIGYNLFYLMVLAMFSSLLVTVLNILLSGIIGFVILPIYTFLLLLILSTSNPGILISDLAIGFGIAGLIVILSYKVRFLTLSGALATFLLAGFIFALGGLKWSVPILTFFILSSILSKVRKKINSEIEEFFEKTGVRDHWQVFANGGLGGILVVFNYLQPDNLFYYMYIASLAAVCADTWATEIGTFKKTKTYNILNLKPITQGMSGGISFPGTFGSFLGAVVIALSGILWIKSDLLSYFLIVIFAGIGGSFFDSLLGATVQAQFYCKSCNKITEKEIHCNQPSSFHKGFVWLNNDIVNLMSGFAGIFLIIFYYYFK